MRNGGYKIINLNDVNLTVEPVKVTGVYEAIENSYRKALLLSGIVIEGVEKNDAFVTVTNSGGNYVITVYGKTITIASTDMVNTD